MKNVCVIGAGAAGLLAAYSAAYHGAKVTVFEKNEKAGKKIYITGKGRCNVTNSAERDDFFENVISNPRFLYSAFSSFDNKDICTLLETYGCELKTERGNRVFPVSDHASDVTFALLRACKEVNVNFQYEKSVEDIITNPEGTVSVKIKNGTVYSFDSVIVATGGLSYPSTGSTGDGYRFAKKLDINVTSLSPSLTGINCKEELCKELMGLTLKNVSVNLMDNDKMIYSDFGELLFTHFGVSGPIILSSSSFWTKAKSNNKAIIIDLKPALSNDELDKRIIKDFEKNSKKEFKNSLDELLPKKLIPIIIEKSQINQYKKVCEISKAERLNLVNSIKNFKLTPVSTRGFEEAIVTKGGIDVKEINPKTMEAKNAPNIYFAGEVLDLDALTGGFNLQIAFSTGYLAGRSAANENN